MTLLSDTAYHSFIGEVEALNTTTIRRLTRSRRHQLLAIAHFGSAEPLFASSTEELVGVNLSEAADAANALGLVELELLRPEQACSAFEKSLALLKRVGAAESRQVPVLHNLATCQLQSGRTAEVRTTIETLRASSGDDPGLRRQAELVEAQVLLREANLKQAGTILRAVVENTKADDPIRGTVTRCSCWQPRDLTAD